MKYLNGTLLKSNPEKLREKVMFNSDTGEEYMAYYPAGYEVLDYFNHGSQVNVSTIRRRNGGNGEGGKIFLLKNENPNAEPLPGDELQAVLNPKAIYGAIRCGIHVGHLVEKCFRPKHAPKIPRVIEGAYINNNPIRSYLIEELVPGTSLSEDLFNDLSKTRQKLVLIELAKTIAKMHFRIPDAQLKISRFPTKSYHYYPDPAKRYKNRQNMVSFFESRKLALTHSDLISRNILYDGKDVIVLDYGRAWCGPRLVDFSSLRITYSENFTHRLMDAYTLVYRLFTKKWR